MTHRCRPLHAPQKRRPRLCSAGVAITCLPPTSYSTRMSTYLSAALRRQLVEADDHRCAYCQTTEAKTGQPMVVDHILPAGQGGQTTFHHRCFACRRCNEYTGPTTGIPDPLPGESVPIFHPRQHAWTDHCAWDAAGIRLLGPTVIGRATIIALNMHNEVSIDARRRWVGVHTPASEQKTPKNASQFFPQGIEQRLGVLQVGGVQALGEPTVDRRQQGMGGGPLALLLPQACTAGTSRQN